mmetsp:Transcript_16511/g.47505  ORF Transcript_16511/g.47505 Transcript_16511/m.47505 type:complete len:369 (-) Transcript_16511:458-1564(-)
MILHGRRQRDEEQYLPGDAYLGEHFQIEVAQPRIEYGPHEHIVGVRAAHAVSVPLGHGDGVRQNRHHERREYRHRHDRTDVVDDIGEIERAPEVNRRDDRQIEVPRRDAVAVVLELFSPEAGDGQALHHDPREGARRQYLKHREAQVQFSGVGRGGDAGQAVPPKFGVERIHQFAGVTEETHVHVTHEGGEEGHEEGYTDGSSEFPHYAGIHFDVLFVHAPVDSSSSLSLALALVVAASANSACASSFVFSSGTVRAAAGGERRRRRRRRRRPRGRLKAESIVVVVVLEGTRKFLGHGRGGGRRRARRRARRRRRRGDRRIVRIRPRGHDATAADRRRRDASAAPPPVGRRAAVARRHPSSKIAALRY